MLRLFTLNVTGTVLEFLSRMVSVAWPGRSAVTFTRLPLTVALATPGLLLVTV